RDVGGRVNGKGGTESDYHIGLARELFGALDVLVAEILSEADGGGLQEAAAVAKGWFSSVAELNEVRFRIGTAATGLAFDPAIGAVKFHQQSRGGAGFFVQAVNVLGNHRQHFAGSPQFHDGSVG